MKMDSPISFIISDILSGGSIHADIIKIKAIRNLIDCYFVYRMTLLFSLTNRS